MKLIMLKSTTPQNLIAKIVQRFALDLAPKQNVSIGALGTLVVRTNAAGIGARPGVASLNIDEPTNGSLLQRA
jgi:hypothetical protein